jgi:cytochrome c oxidase cbb3-type subunit 3
MRPAFIPILAGCWIATAAVSGSAQPQPAEAAMPDPPPGASGAQATPGPDVSLLPTATPDVLRTPVSKNFPGNVDAPPKMSNPVAGNAEAATRGMRYFTSFNCVGCHAANGGGGMGPALSNHAFVYGSDSANIYLSIYQGRPRGMPAWGTMLPANVIWDIVTYIQSISEAPNPAWGTTVAAHRPAIEQVPAEYVTTINPWSFTEAFSDGQKPNRAK